ncbi:MacS family sensor histidine kinase [Gordonia sp. (in: high G+C Gram-positive bacteria)]|uniref:MacS family sensor histidine kinase n=1 Tax=unclassified Gordonia (in: high G+C Gram-positive bacteria) TaxID=2657482 RepID=UPI0026131864|nr:DUF5931 domain-containing protein [Gordonia sp. (in: high G+C Gram-positive bacteria)]
MSPVAAVTALDRLFPESWRRLDDDDPVGPLWRGAQIFRLLGFFYALGFLIAVDHDLEHPGIAWLFFVLLTAANAVFATGYLVGFGRRWWCAAAELACFIAAMLSTEYVASSAWIASNQTWPTTLWCSSALLSAALLGGAWTGAAAGVAIGLANFLVKGQVFFNFGRNATFLLLVVAGMAVGLAASRARVTHAKLTAAVHAAAQAAERERLARHVHDGVLQALALIARRGREIGGPTTELAELAAGQERQLRRLIAEVHPQASPSRSRPTTAEIVDLGVPLRALATDTVSVSTPAAPVVLHEEIAREVLAAVTNVLDNTARHAGPGAHSFVLLEDLDDEVVLSLRDDGRGIAPGRLNQAAAEGRMGISRSIIGRIEALGGSVALESAPGAGTEWELTIPLRQEGDRR